jgi:two-component sensor histidine kinase
VFFSSDDMLVPDQAVTPLGLVFHELVTNAMKYGALSVPQGPLRLTFRRYGAPVAVVWKEEGGPPMLSPPERTGASGRNSPA